MATHTTVPSPANGFWSNPTAGATVPVTPTVTLERVNTPPAQTWNYLRANDITLTVPVRSRQGSVYFALPRLFDGIECGMGDRATEWIVSQATDARYVEVRAGEKRDEPIVVDVAAGQALDVGVMVRAGAEATVVVLARGSKGQRTSSATGATSAALVRMVVGKGARVHVLEFVTTNGTQQHLESIGIVAEMDAHVDVRQFFLGAKTTATGLACSLDGKQGRFDLTCRYLARNDELIDINHVVRQRAERTRANVSESGVLDGHARKTLRATIDLVHGSAGSEGAELESVLMLSDDVTNKTMPVILCDEDDVAGNHGASIGTVGDEQIQYLCARGLTQREVEELYVRALFDEALIASPTKEVRTAVFNRACDVLGSNVAGDLIEGLGLAEEE